MSFGHFLIFSTSHYIIGVSALLGCKDLRETVFVVRLPSYIKELISS